MIFAKAQILNNCFGTINHSLFQKKYNEHGCLRSRTISFLQQPAKQFTALEDSLRKGFKTYERVFKGSELLRWLLKERNCSASEATVFIVFLLEKGVIDCAETIVEDLSFGEDHLYKFTDSSFLDEDFLKKEEVSSQSLSEQMQQLLIQMISTEAFWKFYFNFQTDADVLQSILQSIKDDYEDPRPIPEILRLWVSSQEFAPSVEREANLLRLGLAKVILANALTVKEMLSKTFEFYHSKSHGLAIDLFWELVKLKSREKHLCSDTLRCEYCQADDLEFITFLRKEVFSTSTYSVRGVMDSILGAMIDEYWQDIKPVPFSQTVIRPRLWEICFDLVNRSHEKYFEEFLKECFILLLDNSNNTKNLVVLEGWESWIVPLSFSDYLNAKCESYILGISSRLLFQSFKTVDSNLDDELLRCLLSIQQFSPTLEKCLDVAYKVFHTFLYIVTTSRGASFYVGNPRLVMLCNVLVCFLFCWGDFGPQSRSQKDFASFADFVKSGKSYGIHGGYISQSLSLLNSAKKILDLFDAAERQNILEHDNTPANVKMVSELQDAERTISSAIVMICLLCDKPNTPSVIVTSEMLAGVTADVLAKTLKDWLKLPADKRMEFVGTNVPKLKSQPQ
eukprot:TRINITY_DN7235_c0_g2_i3.p1 TRINITY_DN7235_c0_g2~~TRINITY_DN7235_c0_g2_i3.p1  ORF type:complete len:622 (-),score=136.10 TRINITY_DN7235_c0_g2_i3:1406-3271(-)